MSENKVQIIEGSRKIPNGRGRNTIRQLRIVAIILPS